MKLLRLLTILAVSALCALQFLPAAAQTATITRDSYEANLIRKSFGKVGVGIAFTWVKQVGTKGLTINQVVEGSPAFKAGIKTGDRITAIDGKIILGLEDETAAKLLLADTGLPKKLTYLRDGVDKDVELIRENGLLGIGFVNEEPSFYARIDQVLKGLPAEKAGLMAGDLLVGVDNQTLKSIGSAKNLQDYLSQAELETSVTLTISREGQVFQIRMLRAIVPNVDAKYGVQTFAKTAQTSDFARHDWAELSLWNMDWVDLLNPDLTLFEGQKFNALDEALRSLSFEKYVVWNLQNNIWANDPEQTARIAARFMKVDGWVLSYKDDSTGALTTYRRVGSVLTKEVTTGNKSDTSVVESDLVFFSPKLVLLVNDKTAGGATALAYALRLSKSALVVGQHPSGSTRITRNENPRDNVYQKVEIGSYTMANGGGIGVNVDVTIDRLSASNSTTAFELLVKPDLRWWEDGDRFSSIVTNVIGGIVLFTFICIAVLFTPKSNGFLGLRLRNVALGFLVVEVTVIAAVAFVVMLTKMFWPTMIVFTLAVGVMIGRSMSSK